MLVENDRIQKAREYLADSDKPAAMAKAEVNQLKALDKTMLYFEFLDADGKNVEERKAKAYTADSYTTHIQKIHDAELRLFEMVNRRDHAAELVRVWQSENANRRAANIG